MEHTNHITNQKIHYSTFTKNPISLQILSNKFQLHSKREFQTTHQTRQFPVMQQNIMRRHSKNQIIMSSYSTNQQIKIKTTKQIAKEILFSLIRHLVKRYLQILVNSFLIFQISITPKTINFTVFLTEITSKLARAVPKT